MTRGPEERVDYMWVEFVVGLILREVSLWVLRFYALLKKQYFQTLIRSVECPQLVLSTKLQQTSDLIGFYRIYFLE